VSIEEAVYRNKSQQVSAAITHRIMSSGLRPGDLIGTEVAMLEEYKVSRPTLRESIRRLEAQGIVQLKPGPGGGVSVGHPTISSLVEAFSTYLYLEDVPFQSVLRTRSLIEPSLAFDAALNATEEQIEELERSVEQIRRTTNQESFLAENRHFHESVAKASRNAVLEAIWLAISLLASGEQHGIKYSAANRESVADAHERITDALRQRDADSASALMAAHVGELVELSHRRQAAKLPSPTPLFTRAETP
jgi:DNA-binding FadR family transcriptional regulator